MDPSTQTKTVNGSKPSLTPIDRIFAEAKGQKNENTKQNLKSTKQKHEQIWFWIRYD